MKSLWKAGNQCLQQGFGAREILGDAGLCASVEDPRKRAWPGLRRVVVVLGD